MKMKKEEEKNEDFSACPKNFNLFFSEALNLADFKYVFGFFISFYDWKLQLKKVGPFCLFLPVLDNFCLLWRAVTFDRRKIWKTWIHIWNLVRSVQRPKCLLIYFFSFLDTNRMARHRILQFWRFVWYHFGTWGFGCQDHTPC